MLLVATHLGGPSYANRRSEYPTLLGLVMKRLDVSKLSTGSFEYEADDGPVEVFYEYYPPDPDVGLNEGYDIYIFDGEDDITFDSDHNLYLKIKRLVPDHHRKMISDLHEP